MNCVKHEVIFFKS